VGHFYVRIDFVILDMAKDPHTQFILGRPLSATVSCKIDFKEGKLTFYIGENHTKFGLFKDCELFPSGFSHCRCEAVVIDEYVNSLNICPNNPPSFDYDLFKG